MKYNYDLAASMDQILNSDENKDIFSSSGMLEKLAFRKVSEQDIPTELEVELATAVESATTAEHIAPVSQIVEKDASVEDSKDILTKVAYNTLLKASEELESAGFDVLAAESLSLINRLVAEAKKKKDKKSKSKMESKKDSKKDSKKEKDSKEDKQKDSKTSKSPSKSTKKSK